METIWILLKILIYCVLGYYLLGMMGKNKSPFLGVISPFYGLFSLLAIFTTIDSIPILYITGILWGFAVDVFLGSLDSSLKQNINVLWFGLLNILNAHVLNGLIEKFITYSSIESITFLFIVGFSLLLIDISITFRRMI